MHAITRAITNNLTFPSREISIFQIVYSDRASSRVFPVHEHVELKTSLKQKVEEGEHASAAVYGDQQQHSIRSSGRLNFRKNNSYRSMSGYSILPRSPATSASPPSIVQSGSRKRRIFIMRHAERVDITFGPSWISQFFDDRGGYHRRNLNMPKRLPSRNGGPNCFIQDSPITEIGACQALLTGESLFAHNISITRVLASPALRCVQTAESVMEGLKIKGKVKIEIEPALYEWLAWCKGRLPRWLTHEELLAFGVNIDTNYNQFMSTDNLSMNESIEFYYNRTYNTMKSILDQLRPLDVNILVVGHAASVDVCTRQITGKCPRSLDDFVKINQNVPYCGMSVIEESGNGTWRLVQPPIPSLIHGNNHKFDWRLLQQQEAKMPNAV